MSSFVRYIGIDYSGARGPEASLPGLRVYLARDQGPPAEVAPPPSPRKYWSRRELAEWLLGILNEGIPTVVGIDHGFSFPMQYFQKYPVSPDWEAFLSDFAAHWPSDQDYMYVDFIRDGLKGLGCLRTGDARWRRVCEIRAGAKSVFHFDVPGSVAKSTHAGLPWLLYLRQRVKMPVHFWPFDGWSVPIGHSVVAEAYPRLWSSRYPRETRTPDQHDAYSLARGLQEADQHGQLPLLWSPSLSASEQKIARIEGWILGV